MLIRRLAQALLVTFVAAASLAGCAGNPDNTDPLPNGEQLVNAASEDLGEVTNVAFELTASGTIPGLPVRTVEGVAGASAAVDAEADPHGAAYGEADVQYPTERVQYEFVLDGEVLRLTETEADDGPRELPVPEAYAPARLLDPEQGLRNLLTEATGLTTETREKLGDVQTYRIGGELAHEAISSVAPGVHDDVDVKFWIAQDTDRLMRVWVQVPPRVKNEGAVQLELALTDHNAAIPPCDPVFTSADQCGAGSSAPDSGRS